MWNLRAHRLRLVPVALAAAMLLTAPQLAFAQDSRAEVIRQAQANNQQVVTPPRPNRAERFVDRLERWGLLSGTPRGLYPWVGSVYPGGGMAAGPALRMPFGDDGAASLFGGYSINGFLRAQGDVALPTFARNRARVTLSGQYVDAPDVDYFGAGNASSKADRTGVGYTPKGGSGLVDLDVSRHLTIGGGVSYFDIETSGGKTGVSIADRFTPADTPGLERAKFTYLVTSARAEFDWRRPLGYSGSGGFYRVQFDDHRERNDDAYTFRSAEVEVRQLIPIMRANWVVALRALATVTDADETSAVPYFMLPALGGGSTLRGYSTFRFRDQHRLLMNAELRWTPARFLDMALFYDTGKVASERRDLDFTDLNNSYGIGLRVVGVNGYALRLEVAHSAESAARLVVTTGGSF